MKRLILILIMGLGTLASATTYTEFYVQTTGNNLFSGHTPDNAATYGTTGANFTNNTSASLCTLYKSGLGAAATAVTNGAWCAVFPDGATTNGFIGSVVTNDATQDIIQLSLTAKSGTVPSSTTAGTSFNVGGAWKGPNTAATSSDYGFPFNFVQNSMTNSSGRVLRVNFLAGTYSTTNIISVNNAGPIVFQGYSTTPGDKGRAIIDGTWPGAAYDMIVWAAAATDTVFADLTCANNGASGTSAGFKSNLANETTYLRCCAHGIRGSGFYFGASSILIECEAYACNLANNSGDYGYREAGGGNILVRCIAHDNNSGANCSGFLLSDQVYAINCISSANTGSGFKVTSTTCAALIGCDAYSNSVCGIDMSASSAANALIQNCNLIRNGTYGIDSSGSANRIGQIINCGFGSGTMANGTSPLGPNLSGILFGMDVSGTNIYSANSIPWVNATNMNFTIASGASAKAGGWGGFLQTTINSPTNTVSYPDIGAAQGSSTNSGTGGEHSHVFAQ